ACCSPLCDDVPMLLTKLVALDHVCPCGVQGCGHDRPGLAVALHPAGRGRGALVVAAAIAAWRVQDAEGDGVHPERGFADHGLSSTLGCVGVSAPTEALVSLCLVLFLVRLRHG